MLVCDRSQGIRFCVGLDTSRPSTWSWTEARYQPQYKSASCCIIVSCSQVVTLHVTSSRCNTHSIFYMHRCTCTAHVYNGCLVAWYNVLLTPWIHSTVKYILWFPSATNSVLRLTVLNLSLKLCEKHWRLVRRWNKCVTPLSVVTHLYHYRECFNLHLLVPSLTVASYNAKLM